MYMITQQFLLFRLGGGIAYASRNDVHVYD